MMIPDNVHLLPQNLEFGSIDETINPVCIADGEKATLIDTGLEENIETLKSSLNKHGYSLSDINQIVITHKDFDHCSALETVAKQSNATVFVPEHDHKTISGIKPQEGPEYAPVEPDIVLTGGESIKIGDSYLEAVKTPGHTPGHMSFLYENVLLTGDALNVEKEGLSGPRARFTDDFNTAISSVNKLRFREFSSVVCYHGGVSPDSPETIKHIVSDNLSDAVHSDGEGNRFLRRELDSSKVGLSYFEIDAGSSHGAKTSDSAMHFHEKQEEIYYFISGKGHLVTPNQKTGFSPGDAFKLPPETPRRIDSSTNTEFVVAGAPPNDGSQIVDR